MSSGTVKAVLSGDTVLLMGRAAPNRPPPEMQLSLASLQAPKLGRAPGIPDEPFAWESREFLRRKCIGKQVTFKPEYQAGASGRNFGWVKLDGESLAAAVVKEGWARVKEQGTSSQSSELEELLGNEMDQNMLWNDQTTSDNRASSALTRKGFFDGRYNRAMLRVPRTWIAGHVVIHAGLVLVLMFSTPSTGVVAPSLYCVVGGSSSSLLDAGSGQCSIVRWSPNFATTTMRVHRCIIAVFPPVDSMAEFGSLCTKLMVELGKAAEAAKLGIYTDDAKKIAKGSREVKWTDVNNSELMAKYKEKPVKVTIEHLRDGSSYRVLLQDSWTMASFSLAGVSCPRMNAPARRPPAGAAGQAPAVAGKPISASGVVAPANGSTHPGGAANGNGASSPPPPPQPEPFAAEAKHFAEVRLLHREVDILLQGMDKQGNLYGAVLHPKGDMRQELLKQGLARVVDWSLTYVSRTETAGLRQAENEGKRSKLRLWRDWAPPQIDGDANYSGLVVEIHSGDQITVSVPPESGSGIGEERRLALSSIRAPRMGNPRRGVEDEPWATESKEALRKLVIGKSVKVVVDYQRDIPQGSGETTVKRAFATITIAGGGGGGKCLQELLVESGLATVARLRQDDPRTEGYDAIVAAETAAKNTKKGMHSSATPPTHRMTDLTGDSKKAKTYVNFLVRQGLVKAVVEHVFGGSRFKVFVPKENCAFMLAMTEVRCPQPPRAAVENSRVGARAGEPFGREALAFSRERLMQRSVEVRVVDMDKNGVALGSLFTGSGSQKRNYAADLLKAGMGKLDGLALERLGGEVQALVSAQAAAKAAKAGAWSVEPAESEKQEEFVVSEKMSRLRLCEITDGGHFFVHNVEGGEMSRIEAKLKELKGKVGTSGATMEPRRGTLCAALFKGDNGEAWYRARVLGTTPAGVRVRYIDHGNCANVPPTKLRPLDPSYFAMPPQAKECVMAFMRVPSLEEEFGREAAVGLDELGWGKDLLGRALGKDEEGRLMMALYESEDSESLNEMLVAQGVARVLSNAASLATCPTAKDMVNRLREAQEIAHKSRSAMWRYGDCQSDDEDE